MAAMTVATALTSVRDITGYDLVSPSPVTDTQLTRWVDRALKRLRRRINKAVPSLYVTTSSNTVLTSGGVQTIAKPADFDLLIRLERLETSTWVPVGVSDPLSPDFESARGFLEEGSNFVIRPTADAPGTYRVVYNSTVSSGYTTLEVPEGMEDVIIEEVCARVKERLPTGNPSLHIQMADKYYNEAISALKRRYGKHIQPGLRQIRYGQ